MRVKNLICLSGVAIVVSAGTATAAPATVTLSGAGSTVVAPLISEWATQFQTFDGDSVSYDQVGSQSAVDYISSGAVDFAATDSPLSAAQTRVCPECVQIPWTLTAIGIGYDVPSIGNRLRLTGRVLAQIYLGQITNWNDPRIKTLNPGVSLPTLRITPVYTNASGDTYNFTEYLDRVSSAWRSRVGYGETVSFPTGTAADGSAGVTAVLESTRGAIAFVGTAYLIRHGLPAAALQNAAGNYEYPNLTNIKRAAASVTKVPADNAIQLVDPPRSARAAYPISTFGFVVVSRKTSPSHRAALKKWLTFAIGFGQRLGQNLDFAPIPSVVQKAANASVRNWSG